MSAFANHVEYSPSSHVPMIAAFLYNSGIVEAAEPLTNNVTQILEAIAAGDVRRADDLFLLVYDELRTLAAARLKRESPGQTLQATALVHEAYVRLTDGVPAEKWDSRGHFFSAAAEAMRRILVENARRKRSLKRGGDFQRVDIDVEEVESLQRDSDLLGLDEALGKLGEKDARKAKLVELRYFAGLTMQQAAKALGISIATAQRDWTYARAWLHRAMAADDASRRQV